MVKEECVIAAHELLDYHTDLDTLWGIIVDLERGKGNVYDTANNVESYIKATDLKLFHGHHSKIITALEDIKDALEKGDATKAKIKLGVLFIEYDTICVDLISECECGEFLVKTK